MGVRFVLTLLFLLNFFVGRYGFEDMRAIVAQFVNAVADVVQGDVRALFLKEFVGIPAARQFFEGGDVKVALVEVVLQGGHEARHKAAILTDAVAAHRRFAHGDVFFDEVEGGLFGAFQGGGAGAATLNQSGFAMEVAVPVV